MASSNEHRALTTTWTAVGLILLAILLLYFFKIMLPSLSLGTSKTAAQQSGGQQESGTGAANGQGSSAGSAGSGSTGSTGQGGTGGNIQILPSVTVPSVTVPSVPAIPGL